MISAAEFRKLQAETIAAKSTTAKIDPIVAKKSKNEDEQSDRGLSEKERFIPGCNEFYKVILEEVEISLKHVSKTGRSSNFTILDHTYLMKDTWGFSYTTMMYGFWDKKTQSFDDGIFKEYRVAKPFDLAVKELARRGYKLEDVTDLTRTDRLYLKLSWV